MDIQILKELDKFRDISFKEDSHEYFYRGKNCMSVTTLISDYQKPFETEIIAFKYAKKHNLNVKDVLLDWEHKKNSAAERGTHIHAYAEYRFQNKVYNHPYFSEKDEKLIKMVDDFYTDVSGKLILVKAELVVGDYNLGICGMVDKLFYNVKANEFQIWDYKTNKDIKEYSPYKNKMMNGLGHLEDCEMVKFSLQLGIYKYLIEKNTNIKIGNSYICWLNSDKNDSYVPIETIDLSDEVCKIIDDI